MEANYTCKTLKPQIPIIDFKIKTKFENGVNRSLKPHELNYPVLNNINSTYYIFAKTLLLTDYIPGLIITISTRGNPIKFIGIGIVKI